MPVPGFGSISAIIHMLARGPDIVRSKSLMRVFGILLISLLACLGVVRPVSGDMPLSSIGGSSVRVSRSHPSICDGSRFRTEPNHLKLQSGRSTQIGLRISRDRPRARR